MFRLKRRTVTDGELLTNVNEYDNKNLLATQAPPNWLSSVITKVAYRINPYSAPHQSTTLAHEAGLRKHSEALLTRNNLRPDVKRYIEKNLPEKNPFDN